jgi:hypothetical protein
MATFVECPNCGNSTRIQNFEIEEIVIQLNCPECDEFVEIYLDDIDD